MRIRILALVLAFATFASVAQAATVFNIDGTNNASIPIGTGAPDDGVAQTFEVTERLENVDFSFEVFCLGCAGEVQLITGLMGPTASVTQRFIETTYTGAAGLNSALSGITLEAGYYTLIISMTSGDGTIRATDSPIYTGSGVSVTSDYLRISTIDPNALFLSQTSSVPGAQLKFTISDNMPAVPLPASAFLLIMGCAAFGAVRARRRPAA